MSIEDSSAYHAQDNLGWPGEPDEWQTASQKLYTQEILSIALCKFTGNRVGLNAPCPARQNRQHRDVECTTLYYSNEGIRALDVAGALLAPELRTDGGDVTFVEPVA